MAKAVSKPPVVSDCTIGCCTSQPNRGQYHVVRDLSSKDMYSRPGYVLQIALRQGTTFFL